VVLFIFIEELERSVKFIESANPAMIFSRPNSPKYPSREKLRYLARLDIYTTNLSIL